MADETGAVLLDEPEELDPHLEDCYEVGGILKRQRKHRAVLWAEDDEYEVWVTRTNAGFTTEYRAKPGSEAEQRELMERDAVIAREVLQDPEATPERVAWAIRIAALASLEGA